MATKKNIDASGLLYFGKEYYKKLQTKFVEIESGKTLTTNDYTTNEKEKLAGIEASADVNVVEVVKVNGTALTPNSNKEVNITVAQGSANGTLAINGSDVSVKGLGSAAYAATTDFDASGAAAAVLGASTDASSAVTVYGVKKALEEAVGNGGSVATQISSAIGDLDASVSGSASGTAANGGVFVASGVQVVEADGVITGVNITSTEVDPAGAAASALSSAQTYADGLITGLNTTDTAVSGQFVTAVSETNGVISVSRAAASASQVGITAITDLTASNVQEALEALKTAVNAGGTGSVVTVESADGASGSNILKTYTIKQGGTSVGTINIPKDFLVKSGTVETCATDDTPVTGLSVGDKYLDFVINSTGADATASHIYIPVQDLVDAYTAGNGINVSAGNVISAVVDGTSESFLTVGASGLKLSGVQTAINTGRDAAKTYADGLVQALDVDKDASGTVAHSGTFVMSGVTQVDGLITSIDSVEVEAAGAAASALSSAQTYADTAAGNAETAAKGYADGLVNGLAVAGAVAANSSSYVTASGSGKTVTVGLTSGAITSLGKADTAIQSISKVDGTYVSLAISGDGTAKTITVSDTAIGTALGGKADKVGNAVSGNLAALDANGNLVDSGHAASEFTITYMTNQEIQDVVDNIFAPASGS